MNKQQEKQARLARRHRRVRGKISGTAARPRLCVTRSNSNMYVQVIDDVAHTTICGVSTLGEAFKATGKSGATVEGAEGLFDLPPGDGAALPYIAESEAATVAALRADFNVLLPVKQD